MNKLVFFYDYFTPAYKAGGPVQSLSNLVPILENEFKVYIFTSNTDLDHSTLKVEINSWVSYSSNSKVMYLGKSQQNFRFLDCLIKEINPEILYINGMFSLSFVVNPLLIALKRKIPVLIAPRGMLQKGALAIKNLKKRVFLGMLKLLIFKKKDLYWHATDEQEKQDIFKYFNQENSTFTISNVPRFIKKWDPIKYSFHEKKDFITISLITKKKNHISFINLLNGLIPKRHMTYNIFGPIANSGYKHELVKGILNLDKKIEVSFQGEIEPANVPDALQSHKFFVLPTFGENFGHAIFEALSVGVPVIISDKTPWRNLEAENAGWDLSLDKMGKWLNVVHEAIHISEEQYLKLSKGARKLAEHFMETNNFDKSYKEMFFFIINNRL